MSNHNKIKQKALQNVASKFNRTFSEEFKRALVKDLEANLVSIPDLVKLHQVSRTSIYKWVYLYSTKVKGTITVVQMESEQRKTLELYQKVAELERVIGQKQMELDYLNKVIELAGEELDFDIKKKYEHKQLNGLDKTSKTIHSK